VSVVSFVIRPEQDTAISIKQFCCNNKVLCYNHVINNKKQTGTIMTNLNVNTSAAETQETSILDAIQKNSRVTKAISEAAGDSPEIPWSVNDISMCVYRQLKIDVDMNNPILVGKLLNYFNDTQTELAQR
jgi:hypothetical protein